MLNSLCPNDLTEPRPLWGIIWRGEIDLSPIAPGISGAFCFGGNMSMIPRVTEEGFLCRVSSNSFVAEIDGNTISTTPIPSAAKHMSYQDSDRMTQYLRRRAYRSAVVTDYLGLPVSADAIRAALEPSKA